METGGPVPPGPSLDPPLHTVWSRKSSGYQHLSKPIVEHVELVYTQTLVLLTKNAGIA